MAPVRAYQDYRANEAAMMRETIAAPDGLGSVREYRVMMQRVDASMRAFAEGARQRNAEHSQQLELTKPTSTKPLALDQNALEIFERQSNSDIVAVAGSQPRSKSDPDAATPILATGTTITAINSASAGVLDAASPSILPRTMQLLGAAASRATLLGGVLWPSQLGDGTLKNWKAPIPSEPIVGDATVYNQENSTENDKTQDDKPLPADQSGVASEPTPVYIDPNQCPQSAKHAENAQVQGKPNVLTIDRSRAEARRRAALRGIHSKPHSDRDEYPPAVAEEGGSGASVRHIKPSDNRGLGASMRGQVQGLRDGEKFRVIVKPEP